MMSAASVTAGLRTGAPFSPVRSGSRPGSHRAMVRSPTGAPSSSTASTGSPISRAACAAGSAVVAEANTTVGSAP